MAQSQGSGVQFQTCKNKHHWRSRDSGYLELFHSPGMEIGAKRDPSKSLWEDRFHETPKENLLQRREPSLTPKKDRAQEPARCAERDPRKEQPLSRGWCETPKVSKRDASLRRRLLMCKSVTEDKTESGKTPVAKQTEPTVNVMSESDGSTGFLDSPDTMLMGALATSTLKPEDVALSSRKRRLMFSQVKTSTLEDGKGNTADFPSFGGKVSASLSDAYLNESIICSDHLAAEMLETPRYKFLPSAAKEIFRTPVSAGANPSGSLLRTPSSVTPRPKRNTPAFEEDSGFSSLALDKTQDSSLEHDGSFQELLLPSSTGKETPRFAESRRRARLERQRRLSTLREGGSQSEEEAKGTKGGHGEKTQTCHGRQEQQQSLSKEDEVFLTPLRMAIDRLQDLSLTPALQMVRVMSLRTAKMTPEQTSLEELVRASETPEPFKTTMPLSGMIGRKMGLEKVDIFTELKKRSMRHVLAAILNQLSPEDVYRFGQVCTTWNDIILHDKLAHRRRRLYLKEAKIALELGGVTHVPDAETRSNLLSRSALRSVQAQSRTPSTPQSAKGSLTPVQHSTLHCSKQDEFLQVAKTLFKDECLKPCPRCQHPARCHSVKREGVCSREDCRFQFCTACLCAYHGSKDCSSWSAHRRIKKDLLPGSAQSKRNLRRL